MDHVDQGPHVVDGGVRQDAVAEVEDVAGPAGGLVEDAPGLALDLVAGARTGRPGRGSPGRRRLARAGPRLGRRSTRQSRPMTLPPASRWSSSSEPVSVPKWIDGTDGVELAKSRFMWGWTNRE